MNAKKRPPSWADEWAPGVTCCGEPAVKCASWAGTAIACSVSGWNVDQCATQRAGQRGPDEGEGSE